MDCCCPFLHERQLTRLATYVQEVRYRPDVGFQNVSDSDAVVESVMVMNLDKREHSRLTRCVFCP